MSFFISDAKAQEAGAQGFGGGQLIFIILMFALFYFMLIRPQTKRAKEHKNMVESLAKGDEIVTTGGIVGKIIDLDESFLTVSIAEGVEVKVQRQAISTLLPKGTVESE